MGLVHAEIELINGADLVLARKYIIGEEEIKRMKVKALVDTGAKMMCVNENIQEILQFPLVVGRKERVELADGQIIACDVVGQVELRFKNRSAYCSAIVLPGDSEPLLGAIPLEEMDVLVNPQREELIVNPASPDMPFTRLPTIKPVRLDPEFIKSIFAKPAHRLSTTTFPPSYQNDRSRFFVQPE